MLKILSFFNKKQKTIFNNTDIILYFAGNYKQLYQIDQWLDIFKELSSNHNVSIVIVNKKTYKKIKNNPKYNYFNIYLIYNLKNLIKFYKKVKPKIIFYVNNSSKNFFSLIHNQSLHIHINHGESEKISTFSNQIKAYDYIYIVGEAALNKYRLNLINLNLEKFIKVGRPQIEHISPIPINTYNKKVILYAPTWEGSYDDMNYSSLIKYGPQIINTLIKNNYFIIYKPHPFTGSSNKKYQIINEKIISKLKNYKFSYYSKNDNILNLYHLVDLAIFDNSATIIDFLIFNKPYFLTDFDINSILTPIIKYGGNIINDLNIQNLDNNIKKTIDSDPFKDIRNSIKTYYLGNFNYFNKESTQKFINETLHLINKRNFLLENLKKEQKNCNISLIKNIKDKY